MSKRRNKLIKLLKCSHTCEVSYDVTNDLEQTFWARKSTPRFADSSDESCTGQQFPLERKNRIRQDLFLLFVGWRRLADSNGVIPKYKLSNILKIPLFRNFSKAPQTSINSSNDPGAPGSWPVGIK